MSDYDLDFWPRHRDYKDRRDRKEYYRRAAVFVLGLTWDMAEGGTLPTEYEELKKFVASNKYDPKHYDEYRKMKREGSMPTNHEMKLALSAMTMMKTLKTGIDKASAHLAYHLHLIEDDDMSDYDGLGFHGNLDSWPRNRDYKDKRDQNEYHRRAAVFVLGLTYDMKEEEEYLPAGYEKLKMFVASNKYDPKCDEYHKMKQEGYKPTKHEMVLALSVMADDYEDFDFNAYENKDE